MGSPQDGSTGKEMNDEPVWARRFYAAILESAPDVPYSRRWNQTLKNDPLLERRTIDNYSSVECFKFCQS